MINRSCHVVLFCCFLLMPLIFGGCAANRLISSHADPQMTGGVKEPVLVVGVTSRETVRKLFEQSWQRQLAELGITAIPGFEVMEGDNPATYKQTLDAVEKSGAASVLVTQLESVSSKTMEQLATGREYDTLDKLEADPIFFVPLPKESSRTTTTIQLVSRLYDVQSRKLAWTAVSESKDPVMTRKFIDSLVRVLLSDMRSKEML